MIKTCHVTCPLGLKVGAESWVLVASALAVATNGWAYHRIWALLGAAFLLVVFRCVVALVRVGFACTCGCACQSLILRRLWQVTAVRAGGVRSRRAGSRCGARRRTTLCVLAWAFAGRVVEAIGVSTRATKQFSTALALPPSPPPPSSKLLALSPVGRALSEAAFTVRCEGLSSAQCGANLDSALRGSAAVLELEDGTYTHSSTFSIGRSVTVRAKTVGRVVLDGENSRSVMSISSGTVMIEGLNIIKGNSAVSFPAHSHFELSTTFPHRPHGKSADVSASRVTCFGDGGVLVVSDCECSPLELSTTCSPVPR